MGNYEVPVTAASNLTLAEKIIQKQPDNVVNVNENDPAKFLELKNAKMIDKKQFIVLGPNQPTKHSRLSKYYTESVKVNDIEVAQKRSWLTYSLSLDKIFCTVCLCFGPREDINYLRDGFDNWSNLSHIITKHCTQKNHQNAAEAMAHALSDSTIVKILNIETMRHLSKKRKEAEKLHQYLIRVIDAIRYLIAESISLRGNEEANFYNNSEKSEVFKYGADKFLNLLNLLSQYDEVLNEKLSNICSTKKQSAERGARITFLSNYTQNKLIHTMTQNVKKDISEKVNNSVFFSLSADGTTDITLCEQASIVLRYVTLAARKAVVKEHLISIVETETTTGE
ncbi:zinc finger MYM-type protein 5-like [Hydra vulgaris]|uniref:Zinc finger MYM-type protein 5-like n=1 Tax=Hydra vulgaris TaxID=6087 RepID=A0ABM4DLZ4_HYDVU